jgi:hypothetical protein
LFIGRRRMGAKALGILRVRRGQNPRSNRKNRLPLKRKVRAEAAAFNPSWFIWTAILSRVNVGHRGRPVQVT